MTDKQIIIDGVDVSGCEHYDEVCLGNHHYKWCKDNDNCYYKQLKAKEQECKELKLDLIEAKAHGDYLNNLALSETLNLVSEQLDQLKTENEELKFQNKRLDEVALYWHKRIFKVERSERKLKQTLAEIKEIVKEQLPTVNYNFAKSMHPEMFNCYEQILQKISEVE